MPRKKLYYEEGVFSPLPVVDLLRVIEFALKDVPEDERSTAKLHIFPNEETPNAIDLSIYVETDE